MKGQVWTGQVETGQGQKSQVGTGHVQTSQFRTIQDGIGLVKTVQVRTCQARKGLVKKGQVSIICQPVTGQVWTSQVGDRSIQVWVVKSSQDRSNQFGTCQIKLGQVKSTMERLSWTGVTKFSGHQFFGPKIFLDQKNKKSIDF